MKYLLGSMVLALVWSGGACFAGTAPAKSATTPSDVRSKCAAFGDKVLNLDSGCLNPENGAALVCNPARCFELAPDPRYARVKRLLEEDSMSDHTGDD
jgi:hypothetical protein